MWAYITRRILYSIPILVCVNLITFFLFFYVNTPDDVAHSVLGMRYSNPETVYRWKREHQYHLPKMLNIKDTIFYLNAEGAHRESIYNTLKGSSIREYNLGKKAYRQTAAGEKNYSDWLLGRIEHIGGQITANSIIILDWPSIGENEAYIASTLIEKAVPFLFLASAESRIPSALNNSIIRTYSLGQDGNKTNEILQEIASSIKSRQATGFDIFTKTLFFQKSVRFFWFDFGQSDRQNLDISRQVLSRMGPSLMITVPAFILGLGLNIFIAMIVAYCRGTYVDKMVAIICIMLMSIMSLFYYFLAQIAFGTWLKMLPVSGYLPGFNAIRFVLLPIACSVVIGIGGGVRFYRTIFLEETNKDYVTTARAKGLTRFVVLFKHVLKNALIPILTNVVLVIPMLFVGSLILESFFAIPGLGRFTLEGIHAQDFRIVGSMVYLGAFLYIVGLILTDISYTLVDPRIRFE